MFSPRPQDDIEPLACLVPTEVGAMNALADFSVHPGVGLTPLQLCVVRSREKIVIEKKMLKSTQRALEKNLKTEMFCIENQQKYSKWH